jgi:hypothetical protein
MSDVDAMAAALQPLDAEAAAALEHLVREGPDRALCRINALDFAKSSGLGEARAIAALLHAARLGFFELSWNVLCPSCGGVLDANATLKTLSRHEYRCGWCAAGYEPRLDDIVEVTFTISPRVRRIGAHDPQTLPPTEYLAQIFWSSGVDLPETFAAQLEDITLEIVELPAGEKAILSVQVPAGMLTLFDPVTHTTKYIEVKGEPTRERQTTAMAFDTVLPPTDTIQLRPGPLRVALENRTDQRVLPGCGSPTSGCTTWSAGASRS